MFHLFPGIVRSNFLLAIPNRVEYNDNRRQNTNMKKTFTWWAGWVILFPARLFVMLAASIAISMSPTRFYPVINLKCEEDPDKWKLD